MSTTATTFSAIPLTTVFTPPASCSTRLFTVFVSDSWSWDLDVVDEKTLNCYPSGFSLIHRYSYSGVIFSPGICPSGYVTLGVQPLHWNEDTTEAMCCPSGFWTSGNCMSTITTPTVVSSRLWSSYILTGYTTIFTSYDVVSAFAQPIFVYWGPQDTSLYPATTSHASSGLNSATQISTSVTLPKATAIHDAKPSLPPGAIAGISVAVLVVCLLAGAILVVFFRRKRQSGPGPEQTNLSAMYEGRES